MKARTTLLTFFCYGFLLFRTLQAQTYTITTLGPAPDNSIFGNTGLWINDKGEVLASGVFGAFSYGTSLFLPSPAYGLPAGLTSLYYRGGSNLVGRILNNAGQIVGDVATSSGIHAALWQTNHIQDFATLGGTESSAFDINDWGEIVGFSFRTNLSSRAPFLVTTGANKMVVLPGFPAGAVGSASFINRRHQILGTYSLINPIDQTLEPAGLFIWANGTFQDLEAYVGFTPIHTTNHSLAILSVQAMNDAGDFIGVIGESVTQNFSTQNKYSQFLYLTQPAFGYNPGFHQFPLLGREPLNFQTVVMNNYGKLIFSEVPSGHSGDPRFDYVWEGAEATPLDQILPPNSGWSELNANCLNDLGQIVGQGTLNGKRQAFLLSLRPLSAVISSQPLRIHLGETNRVTFTARNNSTNTFNNVRPSALLNVLGSGGVTLLTGPTPSSYPSLTPGSTASFTYEYRATNMGTIRFWGAILGTLPGSTIGSGVVTSAVVNILPRGDLLIKRASEPGSLYAINEEYQSVAFGKQDRTNVVVQKDASEFNVKVQNNETNSQTFSLKSVESSGTHWVVRYLLNGADISAGIRSSSGYLLPALLPKSSHTVTVRLTPTNALPGETKSAEFTLGATSIPGEPLDVVKATALFVGEIIVNTTGDQPDADPNDDVPDVDLQKPGLQTTLRCAIDFANRRTGPDLIRFEIPASDPHWVDGAPQIEPSTPLPEITETLTIDGWSQNTNSLTPPVVVSGRRLPRPPRPVDPNSLYVWPGSTPALFLKGRECEIRGLVINQFPLGIELAGEGSHVVEGCFFGLNATGTVPKGNGIDGAKGNSFGGAFSNPRGWDVSISSQQNRLGGDSPRARNHFGSVAQFVDGVETLLSNQASVIDQIISPPAIWIHGQAAFGNSLLGGVFGLTLDESQTLVDPSGQFIYTSDKQIYHGSYVRVQSAVIVVSDAPGTLIGNATGGGNLIAAGSGVQLSGSNCFGTTLFGNAFGISRDGSHSWFQLINGIRADKSGFVQIGGLNPGEGNTFVTRSAAVSLVDLVGTASSSFILGNQIGPSGPANFNSPSLLALVSGSAPTIVRGNTFSGYRDVALVVDVPETSGLPGIVSVLENNFNHTRDSTVSAIGVPISVSSGRGITIIGNRFDGPSDERLIVLGSPYSNAPIPPLPNDDFDIDGGPNNQQNWPSMGTALLTGGQLKVQAAVDTGILSGSYQFHVYRCGSDQWHHGQPQELVASGFGNADASGRAGFVATVPPGSVQEGDFLCATVTSPDGSTSEVGPVRRVIGGPDFDLDGNGDATEARVSARNSQTLQGDGNGDGVKDSTQPNVTSFPAPSSQWLTLTTASGIIFSNVDTIAYPPNVSPPLGYAFPLGLVTITARGLKPGASISVTNIFHNSVPISKVFALSAGSGNSPSEWQTMDFIRSSDELRLSFNDGGPLDQDLTPNGQLTAVYAFATSMPTTPQLSAVHLSSQTVALLEIDGNGTSNAYSTNSTTLTEMRLTWPGTSTNYQVEFSTNLTPPEWTALTSPLILTGGNVTVTNLSTSPWQFYRLRP